MKRCPHLLFPLVFCALTACGRVAQGQAGSSQPTAAQPGQQATTMRVGPKLIPWTQINTIRKPEYVEMVIQALLIWRQVTDTACIITGPGESLLYEELRQRTGLHIIPSLSTASWLAHDEFDSSKRWQRLAEDVRTYARVCQQSRVVLEHEYAIRSFVDGKRYYSPTTLRRCLAYMPKDIDVVWYPTVYWGDQKTMDRTTAFCQLVEQELHCRFVDMTMGEPGWGSPLLTKARKRLESLSTRPTVPVLWFECGAGTFCYWRYHQVHEALAAVANYPEVLIYPNEDFLRATRELVGRILQGPTAPGK